MDVVRSLCTNIPNDERINAVKEALDKEPNKIIKTSAMTVFLCLILTLNIFIFIFNGKHCLQTKGCALVQIYEIIFMGKFEEIHIYPLINKKISSLCTIHRLYRYLLYGRDPKKN